MAFDRVGEGLARWVLKYRVLVVLGILIIGLGAASGGRFLGFSTNYRYFFSEENPQLLAFDALENRFSKNDNVLIAIQPESGTVFNPKTLGIIAELTAQAWKAPYSSRVDSISNFQHSWSEEDDLVVEDLVPDPVPEDPRQIENIKKLALGEPLLLNRLISSSGHVTGVNITFQQPRKSMTETPEVVAAVRSMAEEFGKKYPDHKFYLTGMVMMNNAFSEASQNDMQSLIPLMFLVMAVFMWISLRSLSGTFSTLVVIIFSMVSGMGLAGWCGILLTPPSASAPTIIMTLAIADSIHILISVFHGMKRGLEKNEAIIESVRINFQPVFLTSLTTAIGFLCMNFSDAPPFHDLGNIVAMGVGAAFLYSIILLPPLISLLPIHIVVKKEGSGQFMDRLGDYVVQKRGILTWGILALVLLLFAGMSKIELTDVFTKYFDQRYDFRTHTDFVQDNLTGLDRVEFSLGAKEEGGISDPAYLAKVEEFAIWFRQQPEAVHVNTVTDIMKRLNKNMHGDDPNYYIVPDNKELAAQYLLLYEMSLPFGMDLNNQINIKKTATRFTVTLKSLTSNQLREIAQRGENWLRKNAPPEMYSVGIGPSVMFSYIAERNIISMLGGTTVALVLISGIMVIALRSLKLGLISLIPNLAPAGMAFGVWGIFVGEVGMGLSVVSAMSLGIVVDDSVHFLSKYRRARKELNKNAEEAVRYSFHSVGAALWYTSVILVAGFFVLSFSGFKMNSDMALLTGVAIIFALITDFFLLPPLLMKLDSGASLEEERDTTNVTFQENA